MAEHCGMLGHYDDAGCFWGETAAGPVTVPEEDLCLLGGQNVDVPRGSVADGGAAAAADDGTYKFYDFSLPAGAPAVLALSGAIFPESVAAYGGEYVHGMGAPWVPCAPFLDSATGAEVRFVRLAARKEYVETAHRLCAEGWLVSAPVMPGTPHPVHTVQAGTLRWVKDTEVEHALCKFADSMPGRGRGHGGGTTQSGADHLSLLGLVYDGDLNVSRSMMSWGALGACLARRMGSEVLLEEVCEPLASYVAGVQRVQSRRNCSGVAAGRAAGITLAWNTPQKISKEQAAHAAALFYWAAVHTHAPTRPVPAHIARAALELYVRFGHVLLRKRAYQFHTSGGSKRRRDADADADADGEGDDVEGDDEGDDAAP